MKDPRSDVPEGIRFPKPSKRAYSMWEPAKGVGDLSATVFGYNTAQVRRFSVAGTAIEGQPHLRAIQRLMGGIKGASFEFAAVGDEMRQAWLVAGGERVSLPIRAVVGGQDTDIMLYKGGKRTLYSQVRGAGTDAPVLDPLEALAEDISKGGRLRNADVGTRMAHIRRTLAAGMTPSEYRDPTGRIRQRGVMGLGEVIGFGPKAGGGAMPFFRGRSILYGPDTDVAAKIAAYQRYLGKESGLTQVMETFVDPDTGMTRSSAGIERGLRALFDLQVDLRGLEAHRRAQGMKEWKLKDRGAVLPTTTPEELGALDMNYEKSIHHLRAAQSMRQGDLVRARVSESRARASFIPGTNAMWFRLHGDWIKKHDRELWRRSMEEARESADRLRPGRVTPIIRTAEMDIVDAAATAHSKLSGMGRTMSKGRFRTATHLDMLALVPDSSIAKAAEAAMKIPEKMRSAAQKTAVQQWETSVSILRAMGDSAAYSVSSFGMRFPGINREWDEVVLPVMGSGPSAKKAYVNPTIGDALSRHLVGPEGVIQEGEMGFRGISYRQVTEAARAAGPDFYGYAAFGQGEAYEGLLGYKMTSEGKIRYTAKPIWNPVTQEMEVKQVPSVVRMKRGQAIQAIAVADDQMRFSLVQKPRWVRDPKTGMRTLQQNTATERALSFLGGTRRFGDHGHIGAEAIGGRLTASQSAIAFAHAGVAKLGGVDPSAGDLFYTAATRAHEQRGAEGIRTLAAELERQGIKGVKTTGQAVGGVGGWRETQLRLPKGYLDPASDAFLWREGAITKAVAETQRKLGIDLGPETMDLDFIAGPLAREISTPENPITAEQIKSMMKGMRYATTGRLRGGMWERGQVGTTRIRLDDLAGYSAAILRGDVEAAPGLPKSGAKWMEMLEGKVRGSASDWWAYEQGLMRATHAGPEPLKFRPGTEADIRRMTLSEWQAQNRALGKIPKGAGIEALRGTTWVREGAKGLEFDPRPIMVELPDDITVPYTQKAGTKGLRSRYAVVPAGTMFMQQEDEILRGMGGKSLGGYGLKLHQALVGGDIDEINRAHGQFSITARKRMLGKEGRLRRDVFRPFKSIQGTISTARGIEVGQVGVTVRKLKEMGLTPTEIAKAAGVSEMNDKELIRHLKRAGFDMNEVTENNVRGIARYARRKKLTSLKLAIKTEPARDTYHFTSAEVKIVREGFKVQTAAGTMKMSQVQGMAMNAYELGIINRDKDYDFLMAFLGSEPGNQGQSQAEQLFLEDFHRSQSKRRTAMKILERQGEAKFAVDYAKNMGKSIEMDAYHGMLKKHHTLIDQTAARFGITGDAGRQALKERIWMGRSQTLAQAPGEFTGFMNLRWRRAREVVAGIATGHDVRDFMFREGVDLADENIKRAFSILSEDKVATVGMLDIFKASEYDVLKKGAAEAALGLAGDKSMRMMDPQLHAAFAASGMFKPGSTEANKAIGALSETIYTSLEHAQGNPLAIEAYARTGEFSEAKMRAVATDYAKRAQALAYAMLGTDSRGREIGMMAPMELLKGGDPEHAMRDIWGLRAEAQLAGARNYVPGQQVPAGASLGEIARMEGDEALRNDAGKSISQRALDLVDVGENAFRKMWGTRWGKIVIGAGGVVGGIGIAKNLFGSNETSPGEVLPPSAQLGPPPMMDEPGGPAYDFTRLPEVNYAPVERVPGVRTHLQASGVTSGHNVGFMQMADNAFGRLGLQPRHTGFVQTDANSPLYRHELEAEIRNQMNSSF